MTDVSNALVEVQNGQIVVSSLQIAEHFGKRHCDVLEAIRIEKGVTENSVDPFEKEMFHETTYIHPQNKQEYPIILMNRDGFSLIAMGFTGKKASEWKRKYIRAFNEMEEQIKQTLTPSYQITDEIARAKRWIEEAEERKQLAETNQRLEQELAEEKEFKETVFDKGDCVSYTVAHKLIRSKIGNINRTKFFEILHDRKIINKNNLPKAILEQKGYFKTKTTTVDYGNYTKDYQQGVVTPKGLDWLITYFKKYVLQPSK